MDPVTIAALLGLAAKLGSIIVEQATASSERRIELRAEADLEYQKFVDRYLTIDAVIAGNNADADAKAQAIDTLNRMHAVATGAGAKVDE